MRSRTIANTDLEVSVVGMGCWAIGGEGWGDDVTESEACGAVAAAFDAGITLFDTAPIYGRGEADRRLRAALGPRIRDVVVATKVGPRFEGDHPISDLTPKNLVRDVEESLARLGLETIPLLQVHWPCDLGTPLEASLEALEGLVERGLVRHLGLCNYDPAGLEAACANSQIATLQTPLSLVRRDYDQGLRQAVERTGVGVLAYEPLARGLLTGKFRTLPRFPRSDLRREDPRFWAARYGHLAPRVERLRQLATRLGTTPAALAVAWAASHGGVVAALAGAKRPAQILETARAGEILEREGAEEVLAAVGRAI